MKIIAHRGNSTYWPENTLAAFRSAMEAGADGIELDVRLTRDRQVVVFHDETGQRLCQDPRRVRDLHHAELEKWLIQRPGGDMEQSMTPYSGRDTGVPLLEQVLVEIPSNRTVYIELKEGGALLDVLSPGLHAGAILLTFDPEVARAAKERSFPVWLNVEAEWVGDIDDVIALVLSHRIDGISMGYSDRLNHDVVERVHRAGLPLAVWTVNDLAVARPLRDWGVDALMTDDPGKLINGLVMNEDVAGHDKVRHA